MEKRILYELCGQLYIEAVRAEIMNERVLKEEDEPEDPPNQMNEPHLNAARRP